jgi:drug/metabolite transporter (DMT)-like permease
MNKAPLRPRPRLTQTQVGIAQMLVGTVIISFSAVFVKLAHVGPTTSAFYRVFFGAIFLLAVALVKRQSLWRGRTPFLLALVAGLLFSGDLVSWHKSILYIGPGLSTILANFQVFFLAAIGVFVFKERITWRLAVSIPLAVVGLFLLVGVDWGDLDAQYKTGVWLGLLCAVIYTVYLLVLRRSQMRLVRLLPTANLAIISVVTAVVLGPVGYLQGEGFRIPDAQTAWSLVALGVLCQAVGWIVISRAVVKIEASRVGLLLLLQPTLTFVWDILLFDRPTAPVEILGALLAVVAIYFGSSRGR